MWKDFFYYSKGERRAVYVLLSLIVVLLIAILAVPEKYSDSYALSDSDKALLDSVVQEKNSKKKEYPSGQQRNAENEVKLFSFNPNLADSIELSLLGIPRNVVRNILKYRQKGGRFLEPASLKRIYGLSAEKYAELEPYIRIPKEKKEVQDTLKPQETPAVKPTPMIKYAEGILVDVGVADTTELKKIPGIGSGIAKAIVSYRKRLGGFYDLAQLSEIKYITPDMMKWFKLENPSVSQLEINKASLDKLRAHPYINFYQAKVIVEYRKKKGEIKSLSQLSLYEEFTEKDLKRLSAYLKF